MRAGAFVVLHVPFQEAPEPGWTQNDHVIETLASHRSDEAFDVRILPGRARGGQHLGDCHGLRRGIEARE